MNTVPKIVSLEEFALQMTSLFHQRGHAKLNARKSRSGVLITVQDETLARLRPDERGVMHLSYYNHHEKWEPMPFRAEKPKQAVELVLEVFEPHIAALQLNI